MTPQHQAYYQLAISRGVLIEEIFSNTPANRGGLQQGDILISADGVELEDTNGLEKALAQHKPIDSIRLKIYRGRRIKEVSLKLEELPKLENLPRGVI